MIGIGLWRRCVVASPHFSNPGDHIIFWFERPQGIAPTVFNTIDGLSPQLQLCIVYHPTVDFFAYAQNQPWAGIATVSRLYYDRYRGLLFFSPKV